MTNWPSFQYQMGPVGLQDDIGRISWILLNVVNVYFKFLKNVGDLSYKLSCYYISTCTNPLEHMEDKMRGQSVSILVLLE